MKEEEKKGQQKPGLHHSRVSQATVSELVGTFDLPSVVARACLVGLLVNKSFLMFPGRLEGSLKLVAVALSVPPY